MGVLLSVVKRLVQGIVLGGGDFAPGTPDVQVRIAAERRGSLKHPFLQRQVLEALLDTGNETEIGLDVVLGNQADRDFLPSAVGDDPPEDLLTQKDAKRVVQQHPVAGVRDVTFGLIEPLVDGEVILGDAAEFAGVGFGVKPGMGHRGFLLKKKSSDGSRVRLKAVVLLLNLPGELGG